MSQVSQSSAISPEYFYPLYKSEDKYVFKVITAQVKAGNQLRIIGTKTERTTFVKLLVYSGKMKEYRLFRDQVVGMMERGELNLKELITFGKTLKVVKGIDVSWAIFIQDQRLCEVLDEFFATNVQFLGTDQEFIEFVCRYVLTQLLQDWRGPKMAVALESLRKPRVEFSFLNKLLASWDFTHIFKNMD